MKLKEDVKMFFPRSVYMEELSSKEIEDAINNGYKTVLVGFGAMEQHGPHLPISTDTITARELTIRVALKNEYTLVAPTLICGSSVIHRFFKGTFNIDREILFRYVSNYIDCLLSHGFERIFLVATHGGNFSTVDEIIKYYSEKKKPVYSAYSGEEFIEFMHSLSIECGIPLSLAGTHSGEMETSIYMYLTNDKNVLNNAPEGFCGNYSEVRGDGLKYGMAYISPNGVIGDARLATYENGRYYTEKLIDFIAEKCR